MAAELFLLLLPSGHVLLFSIFGAVATGADAALGALLVLWSADLLIRKEFRSELFQAVRGGEVEGMPPRRYLAGLGLLVAFSAWVAASGSWGFHPQYALAKGVGMGALALGAAAIATSGIDRRRALAAWLGGAALAVLLTAVLALGSPQVATRVYYGGSGVHGLPFPRLSGPFPHPNLFGDYLVVSLILLWGMWPHLGARLHRAGVALAAALGVTLGLTASTALIGGGVAAFVLGGRSARDGARVMGRGLQALGVVVAVVTCLGVLLNLEVRVNGMELVTAGIRPAIWRSSLAAVMAAPVLGVGASPYLARAADPLQGGAVSLWDAHNAYLSVLGQFGVVGLLLVGGGVWLVVSSVWRAAARSRFRFAVLTAIGAAAVNGLFSASEDMRHLWVLLGLAGLAMVEARSG